MSKNKIYDLIIIILLYIGISSLPFNLIPISNFFITILRISAQILAFFIIQCFLKKSKLIKQVDNSKGHSLLLFLPLFIVCFSNFFCLLDSSNSFEFSFNGDLILTIFLSILIAFNEEYIFRLLLITNIPDEKGSLYKIIISSLIFSLCHLTHFLSSFNPVDLIDVVYTFGIGIVLGLIFVYGKSFVLAVVYHALYNVINGNFAQSWIRYGANSYSFYYINIIVAAVAITYVLLIYFVKFREHKN